MGEFRAYYITLKSARDCLFKLFKAGIADFNAKTTQEIYQAVLDKAKTANSNVDDHTCHITVITPSNWYRAVQCHLTKSKLLRYKPPLNIDDLTNHSNFTVIVEDSLEKTDNRVSFDGTPPANHIRISIHKYTLIDKTHIQPTIKIENSDQSAMINTDLDNITLPEKDINTMNDMFDGDGNIKEDFVFHPDDEDNKNTLSLFSKFASKLSTPHFDPNNSDDINVAISQLETMDNLDNHRSTRLLTLNFLQSNNLNSTAVSLTTDQLSNMKHFAEAMRQRYGRKTNNLDLRQKTGENETDYISRYTRQFNLVKGLPLNTPLEPTDKILLKTRIIDGLKDSDVRLKIREQDPLFDDLGDKIRQLRQAKESENDCPQHQSQAIALLTEQVQGLLVKSTQDNTNETKQECANCGRGHLTSECRTNQKGRTQNNRRLQPRYNRNYPIQGPHLFSPPHAPPRPRFNNYSTAPFVTGASKPYPYQQRQPNHTQNFRRYNNFNRPPQRYNSQNYSNRPHKFNRPYNSNRHHPYGQRPNQYPNRQPQTNFTRHVEPSDDKTLIY